MIRAAALLALLLTTVACYDTTSVYVPPPDPNTPTQYVNLPVANGPGITAPRVVKRVEAKVSDEFRAKYNVANATVGCVIDQNGRVLDTWYVSGNPEFAQALQASMKSWEFRPAFSEGRAITVRSQYSGKYSKK